MPWCKNGTEYITYKINNHNNAIYLTSGKPDQETEAYRGRYH